MVVRAESPEEMLQIAEALEGQLTCTLQLEDSDIPAAQALLPTLERKAGRCWSTAFPLVWKSAIAWCTGAYPASTNFGATSLAPWLSGVLSARLLQNFPDALLRLT